MKELSIEEKAKCYNEALAKAAKIHRNYKGRVRAVDVVIEEVFPELKESEDERIRKEICKLLWDNAPYEEAQEYIAWPEKQGNPTEDELEALRMAAYEPTKNWSEKLQSLYEKLTHCEQKPVFEMKTPEESLGIDSDTYNKIVDECIFGEQKSDDVEEVNFFDDFRKTDSEVEPKFKVGDWVVTDKNNVVQIKSVNNGYYIIDNGMNFNMSYIDRYWHLWTIQDAKDGDVLAAHECLVLFKEIDGLNIRCYCTYHYLNHQAFYVDTLQNKTAFHPATKEQRDLLFQKMKETGYKWDAEKKELKKIEQKPANKAEPKFKIGDNIEPIDTCLGSPRTIYKICDGFYETNQGTLNFEFENNWRLIEQKPAWSEEDENNILFLTSIIEECFKDKEKITLYGDTVCANFTKEDVIDRLKSLRPQSQWKPSDEQMDELRKYSDNVVLRNLYYNLKKLKE